MRKTLALSSRSLEYSLRRSERAKKLIVRVNPDGDCIVTIPRRVPAHVVDTFLVKHADWIFEKIAYYKKFDGGYWLRGTKEEFETHKHVALRLAKERVDFFCAYYGVSYKKITIRNQKTRWGSCSKQDNLSFHYKIALLPPRVADYIIVHEVCHLGEFNHSTRFWNLVEKSIPEYKTIRAEICK